MSTCVHLLYSAAVGVLLSLSTPAFAAGSMEVASYQVGAVKVDMLSEKQAEGKSTLLTGLDEAKLKALLPGGTYPTAFNAFLLRTPQNTVLVDAGWSADALLEHLKALQVAPEQIDNVVLTHMHPDHIGGLLVEGKPVFPGATVYIAGQERDYWSDDTAMNALPEGKREGFMKARAVLDAYGKSLQFFSPVGLEDGPTELLPGVKAVAAFGHTPGHTMFLIASEGQQLLLWGDLVHAVAVQTPHPEAAIIFDVDAKAAVATRQAVFASVARQNIPVGGMHVPFPGMGILTVVGAGYVFTPFK